MSASSKPSWNGGLPARQPCRRGRLKAARLPARKALEEFDFTFQPSVKKTVVEHLGHLYFMPAPFEEPGSGDPSAQPVTARNAPMSRSSASGGYAASRCPSP
jgi:hypothetical protein